LLLTDVAPVLPETVDEAVDDPNAGDGTVGIPVSEKSIFSSK
jgi:hypothetical protein